MTGWQGSWGRSADGGGGAAASREPERREGGRRGGGGRSADGDVLSGRPRALPWSRALPVAPVPTIEIEQELDSRWLAEVPIVPRGPGLWIDARGGRGPGRGFGPAGLGRADRAWGAGVKGRRAVREAVSQSDRRRLTGIWRTHLAYVVPSPRRNNDRGQS